MGKNGDSLVLAFYATLTYDFSEFLGADTLVGKLSEKLNRSLNHKLVLAHMPLIMVCIEVRRNKFQYNITTKN